MYEIKISVDAGLLDVEKDGVRVLRPNDDASLIELDAFLGVIQGSLDPDSGNNLFLEKFDELLDHVKSHSATKSVSVTVTTTKSGDGLIHKFHLSSE